MGKTIQGGSKANRHNVKDRKSEEGKKEDRSRGRKEYENERQTKGSFIEMSVPHL